jgi:hypothetical protein
MACRKAAYRAMTELSEFNQKQQEKAAEKLAAIEKELRRSWTPTELFDVCCVPWLADGAEVMGHKHLGNRGCSGGCGKEHPRISLDFVYKKENDEQQSVASLSHALDPFVEHFEELCRQGLATRKISSSEYYLTGSLQTHVERLQQRAQFGFHLVKVSPKALAASKRAHERQMEQEELLQATKKRKIRGPAANDDLLESVLEICYNHCLLDHLDLAEIAWMRLSCKTMAKIAAKMASSRLKQSRLSYSILVDGTRVDGMVGLNKKAEGTILTEHGSEQYKVLASHVPLSSN